MSKQLKILVGAAMFAILAFVGMLGVFTFSGALPVQGQTYDAGDAGDAASDRAALVALYNATGGANWGNNRNWLSNAPMGEWHGVTTDSDGRVTHLDLDGNQLTGEIPAELGDLTSLQSLWLQGNQLTGEIPAELGNLTNLKWLDLAGNQLTGEIPAELRDLTNLEVLSLFNNQLTGEIPAELGDLTNLEELYLNNNQLTGEMPAELGGLTNLEVLSLYDNQLTGEIPAELGNLTNLKWLSLYLNQLTGAIPAELGDLTNLEELYLFNNQLTGEIPAELGNLTNLKWLALFSNQLTGEIPAELGNLTNLRWLRLYDNQLTGEIPAELGSLTNLEVLYLFNNQLTGEIPAELGGLTNLEWLALFSNQLTGEIPAELGRLPNLEVLDLDGNQLTGEIPAELGNLTNLQFLRLQGNQLTGCIPAGLRDVPDNDLDELGLADCASAGDAASDRAALVALYNATGGANWGNNRNWLSNAPMGEWHGVTTDSDGRVTHLDLDGNQLTGEIPAELGSLTNLEVLSLNNNQLTGAIPAKLGDLTNLEELYLNNNQLTGEMPVELGGLTNLEVLSLYDNQLTGAIPAELGDLTNLEELSLYLNQLTGAIPAELGDLTNLEELYLNNNQLTGAIPVELGGLTNLEELYLNNNQLTGEMPAELGDLTNLEVLSLYDNQLTGEMPAELGDLTNLEVLSLYDNQLTGEIPAELGGLTNLKWLYLDGNQLTGEIPAELGDLTNLEELYLSSNQLTGEIPAELGNLTNLKWLALFSNQLTGEIPAELGNLTNLRWLRLYNNQLTGEIPAELGSLTNLEVLSLYDNQLTGEIPAELGSLTNLTELQLRSNQLTGCIPQDLRGVPGNDLSELGLPFCDIPGAVTAGDPLIDRYDTNNNGTIEKNEVIEAIKDYLFGEGDEAISKGDVIRLIKLYLFGPSTPHNRPGAPEGLTAAGNGQTRIYLSWSAPASDGGAAITGYRIEVSENGSTWIDLVANTRNAATRYSHTGLTAGSTRHYRVSAINSAGTGLASNITTGPTATTAGDAATDRAALAALYNATGGANWQNNGNWLSNTPIGEWHGVTTDNDGRVTQLLLSFNQLTGDIPAELGSLTNLEGLSLNFNQLTGEIPAELGSLTNLRWLYLSNNQLTGEIPAELGSLTNLKDLWLFTNQLTGEIPAELDSLTNLVSLYLASNQLVGCIPSGLRDVPRNDLAQLGLNYCMLEGTSPDLVAFVTSVGEGGNLYVGESFTINAEVHNQGTGPAASANLRYYRSTDPIISTSSDTLIGTDVVDPVPVSWTRAESLSRTAPSRTGTYYYYVCVVPVAGESDILNNCSQAFRAQVLERTSPDLVAFVTSVGEGGNLYVGESFTINAEVHNQGTGPAASANLSYYRSTDPIISTSSDTLIGTDVVDPVPVSWTRAESLSRTAPSRTGTYYYYVCVVPVTGESDILNNCSQAFRAQVLERTSPDLVAFVTSVGEGGNLYVGESFTINAEVHNQGTGPAASANLSYYRSTDPIISTSSDTLIGTDVVDPVPVSWTRAESLSRTAPSRTGTYYYYVCVVPVAGESDILNNCSQAFRAQVLERTSPDLVAFVTSVGEGGNLYVGESFTINAEVHNQGTGPAASANLRYYRSTDPIISTSSDTLIGTDVVDPVPVSWTRAESLSRTAPSRTGTYYYYVCVVPVAGESDILNNCSQAFRAQVLERTSPDLVAFVTSVGEGGNLYVGESFTINAEVHNQGTGPAASANLSYYRSTDPIISTSSDTLIGTDVVDPVPVSWTRAESLSRTAPSRTGTYYYYVCVVPVAGESDILNNCSQAFRAQVLERTSPDLVAFVTSVGDGGNLYVGDPSATISARVGNEGDGTSSSTPLRFYFSSDSSITPTDDTLVGEIIVGAIGAGSSRDYSISMTAPSRTGTYYYYVCVVPVAGESDIQNNCQDVGNAVLVQEPVGSSYFDCGRNYTLSFNFPFVGYNYWFEGTIRARTSLSSVTVKTYVDLGFEERGYIGDGDGNLGSMSANQSKDYSVTEFHDILTYTTYTGCDFYLEWEY